MSTAGLLFLGALVLVIAAPFVAIWSVRANQSIGRVRYAVLLGAIICFSALLRLPDLNQFGDWAGFLTRPFGVISIAVTIFLITRIAAMRAKSAGLSKEVCYVFFVPIAGLFLAIALLFLPPEETRSDAEARDLPQAP